MVRILMVDDHTLIRKGLNQILPELGGFVVADEASAASEALNQVSGSLMEAILDDGSIAMFINMRVEYYAK